MNMFTVEDSPEESAYALCDRHSVKMILESTQMLSHYMRTKHHDVKIDNMPNLAKSHFSHPVTIWTLKNVDNATWHLRHLIALNDTYTARYNRDHVHRSLTDVFSKYIQSSVSPKFFPVCVHDDCYAPGVLMRSGTLAETIASYRADYNKHKAYFAKWKMGNVPIWFHA